MRKMLIGSLVLSLCVIVVVNKRRKHHKERANNLAKKVAHLEREHRIHIKRLRAEASEEWLKTIR